MSFRETSAWISLASLILVFGFYFYEVGVALRAAQPDPGDFLGQYIGSVVLVVIVQVVLSIIAAIVLRKSQDVRAARDERERLIELKSNRFAFYILQIGIVLTVIAIDVGVEPFVIGNCLVLTPVVGEIVRFGGQIVYYRLGL